MPNEVLGWYSRGYLPHYDDRERLQSITYRLCDALPSEVVLRLEEQNLDDVRCRQEIEALLDAGYGSCLLRDPQNAEIVIRGWQHFDGERYQLHAWCVMPNHVHVLIGRVGENTLASIVQSQKSYTAKAILKRCPGTAGLRPALRKDAGGTPAVPGLVSSFARPYSRSAN